MRHIKNKLLLSVLTAALVGGVVLGTSDVFAQDTHKPADTLVQKIADRFKLNKDDVQKVFDEEHQEHHEQMEKRFEEKLTQAVKDGKITEAQKQALLSKLKEREATREKFESMTPEERKSAMNTERQNLSDWAKEQGIDLQNLFPGRGMMMNHRGMMH